MIHGVLNVYKEKGFTSHDVVAKLRGIAGQKKIGHTGTLDPDAEGVLPVCLGKATKLCDLLTDKDKTYEAVMLLGITTDTQDISGTILEEKSTDGITKDMAEEVIRGFVGDYDQIPPMYSALKVQGKKLYELARQGIEVERKARRVRIIDIEILEADLPRVRMSVTCSKGTYIRTLCDDIGQKLGCGACMEKLLRTRVERFKIEDSLKLSEIQELKDQGKLETILLSIDSMFPDLAKVTLDEATSCAVKNGNIFYREGICRVSPDKNEFDDEEKVLVYDDMERFVAIYQYHEENKYFKIVKMFFDGKQ